SARAIATLTTAARIEVSGGTPTAASVARLREPSSSASCSRVVTASVSLRGAEELIGRGIRHAGLCRRVRGVAAGGGGDAALGVGATDEGDVGEDARALVALGFQEQPGYRGRGGRVRLGDQLADHRGSVGALPGRAGGVRPGR